MLCARDGLSGVRLRILYVDEQGEGVACYEEDAEEQTLQETFRTLCAAACVWEEAMLARRRVRDVSLDALPFPYDGYRAGQRRFAAGVYVAIRDRKRLFAQAPTGIGKTMAALYPALRALGEGKCSRVLYLTARTTGRRSAADALAFLQARAPSCLPWKSPRRTSSVRRKDGIAGLRSAPMRMGFMIACPMPFRKRCLAVYGTERASRSWRRSIGSAV